MKFASHAYYFRFLPVFTHNKSCLLRGAPRFPSYLHSPVFFSPVSFACLATLRVDFFKVLSIQYLESRNGYIRSLTCSVCVAEVTRVNIVSVSPIQYPGFPGYWSVAWGCPVSKFPGQPVHSLPTKPLCLPMGMAVAVSRGTCMDELIYISTWCDVKWCGWHDHTITTVLTALKEIGTLQMSVRSGWWIILNDCSLAVFFCYYNDISTSIGLLSRANLLASYQAG